MFLHKSIGLDEGIVSHLRLELIALQTGETVLYGIIKKLQPPWHNTFFPT